MEMMRINSDSIVDMIFHLKWKSESAIHTDGYQASRINVWRDFFPPNLLDEIRDRQAGDRIEIKLKAGEILPPFDKQNLIQLKRSNSGGLDFFFWHPNAHKRARIHNAREEF